MATLATNEFTPDYSTFTPKSLKLMAYAEHPRVETLMAAGGIRSGKSVTLTAITVRRALNAAGSRHGFFHAFANVCKRNLFDLTVPETFEILMPGYWDYLSSKNLINITDRVITLHNGSKLLFFGLDDANKIRGQQFTTVWVNEANIGINYSDITLLQGRLSQTVKCLDGTDQHLKMLIDLNPTVKSSWEYQVFVEGLIPGERSPLEDRHSYKWVKMNMADNLDNLPPGAMKRAFGGMGASQRQRDEHGEWGEDNPNALFDATKIGRLDAVPEDMKEIVVTLDPAGTASNKSDSTGIIVAGKGYDGKYYVFEDATMKAKPDVWIRAAETLRLKYDANWIVSEKDYARDILVELIARTIPNAPIKYVESRGRGKRLRAEPIAAMYSDGLVNHVTPFRELEAQMVEFDSPGFKGSPDRVDALVYALQHLSGLSEAPSKVLFTQGAGYWQR